MNEKTAGTLRHLLTFLAGLGVSAGFMQDGSVDLWVEAVSALVGSIGLIWSLAHKTKVAEEIQDAQTIAKANAYPRAYSVTESSP